MAKKSIRKDKNVVVIGLGYVGLPLATLTAQKGYTTFGLDQSSMKVNLINKGVNFLEDEYLRDNLTEGLIEATTEPSIISNGDIIIVCVPTPVDDKHLPDLGPVKSAVTAIAQNMQGMPLVIIESTINPKVCEGVVEPIFREAGKEVNKDYHLAHCPERINPGDPNWNVTNIPRVVGAFDQAGLNRAVTFYKNIIDAKIMPMNSIREAEAAKIIENSFRDINIAFVNELAKSFDKLDIDVVDVIKGASTKPFAFMPHWPSCGVGGHCIPVDPYYLIEEAKNSGFDHKFLRIARDINNSMPEYTVEVLQDQLNKLKMPLKGTKVGVLGIAYKANVNDVRESPSLEIIEALKKHEAKVLTYDPFIPEESTEKSLKNILKKSDAIIIATNHTEFVEMDLTLLRDYDVKVLVDGKNCLDKSKFKRLRTKYKGIGR